MPIVKTYAEKVGLVSTIDQMVDTQMELSPGIMVLDMVLGTLSGRTPLYRIFRRERHAIDSAMGLVGELTREVPVRSSTSCIEIWGTKLAAFKPCSYRSQ